MQLRLCSASIIAASLAIAPFVDALSPRSKINDSYDFVVVGGGQAGLVLGGRLAEDTNHTVLVLESGGDGDDYRKRIDTPAYSYFDSLWTTPLNWGFYTVAQPNVNDREIYWPRGKVLGGSSAINGLYMTRPGEIEVNAWKDLLGDMDGANNWSWESLYAAMKKSETFAAPTDDIAKEADIAWNVSSHGTGGPIYSSYPNFTFSQVGDWMKSMEEIGIPGNENMYGGETWGAEVSTSSINPNNGTRSYSRTGYLDPLPDHGNYDVLANAHVTRVLFDSSSSSDNLTANAVEYTTDEGKTKLTVKVNKEVILAAGSVGSPAVLLHSGVGPKDVLSDAGVKLVSELPGVGQHLQDHFDNPKFLTYIDSALAYANASAIYGTKASDIEKDILDNMDKYAPKTTYDDGVVAGYKAIYKTTAKTIFDSPTGQIEILFMNSDGNGDIGVTAALQHPYSHGRIYINSSDPMKYPVIDPNYLSNPSDFDILSQGLKLARRFGHTGPLKSCFTNETSPGSSVQSDDDWEDWVRKSASTEFHPSSSCAMLPRDQGGVVDANLRVYGLANVRVADASVPPIALSTHLMSSTYGIAEQASDIIRKYWNVPSTRSSTRSSTASSSSSTGGSGGLNSAKSSKHSSANGRLSLLPGWMVLLGAVVSVFLI
ncbi:hypothetical protein N7492_004540 [Penicillium capsulatum]|uniref:glucose oxidase n=1 Tax=Penicillium capsulatum TaxID=69766 RepID=A0A9W9IE37_9EURO|nr:hypothetical protein N7492_004540 [Penicillium capsulatum]